MKLKNKIGVILVGAFMVYAALHGIITGEIAGIGSHNGPLRLVNREDDFYEFWFINLTLLYFGLFMLKRAMFGKPNKK